LQSTRRARADDAVGSVILGIRMDRIEATGEAFSESYGAGNVEVGGGWCFRAWSVTGESGCDAGVCSAVERPRCTVRRARRSGSGQVRPRPAVRLEGTLNESEILPPCARCGRAITDDEDGDTLIVYATLESEFDPHDPGPVLEAYCATCTRLIEQAHERHDREVAAFREELDRFGRPP
jgi:hypothetical protein